MTRQPTPAQERAAGDDHLFTVTVSYVQVVTYEIRTATAADAAEDYILGDVVGEGDPEPMLPVGVVEGRVVYEGPFALPRRLADHLTTEVDHE